jgi:hypothetical protein
MTEFFHSCMKESKHAGMLRSQLSVGVGCNGTPTTPLPVPRPCPVSLANSGVLLSCCWSFLRAFMHERMQGVCILGRICGKRCNPPSVAPDPGGEPDPTRIPSTCCNASMLSCMNACRHAGFHAGRLSTMPEGTHAGIPACKLALRLSGLAYVSGAVRPLLRLHFSHVLHA